MTYYKRLLFAIVSLISLTQYVSPVALAETKQTPANEKTTSEAIPTPASSSTFLTVGPGMAFFRGNTGWSLNAGAVRQVQPGSALFVGADLGLDFWSFTGISGTSGATGLQLTPTAIYRFSFTGQRSLYPYIGVSAGPHVYFDRSETIAGGAVSQTRLYFEFLVRPGLFTRITETVALNLEPKLGFLASEFIFLPQATAVFTL